MQKSKWVAVVCLLVLGTFGFSVKARAETTMSCPSGTYDMLDWMTLDSTLRSSYHVAGNSNPLYTNLGGGKFKDVSKEMNLQHRGWSGDASFCDLNQDGYPDLYVLNMQGDDRYYENDRGHRFVEKTAAYFPKTPWGAMGIKFFDWNLVLVPSYRYNCNSSYASCGDKEEYYLAQKYGLVQWVHYSLVSGVYKVQQKTVFNQLVKGTTTPVFPCF